MEPPAGGNTCRRPSAYSPKFIYDAIKLTAEARLKGEKLAANTIIPSVLITKENAKQFYFPDSPF